jgi:hypothetical protein
MKVIQSFAQFDEGSPYVMKNGSLEVNFYAFLLSFLTLKKHYGLVTMHCNKNAYKSLVRHIPYDEIVFRENDHGFKYWNLYKVDSIMNTKGNVVHVDSDVFIFNPVLDPFMYGMSDGIVQDLVPFENNKNFSGEFVPDNENVLKYNNIFDSDLYDGRCFSCGVLGISEELKKPYLHMVNTLKHGVESGLLYSRYAYVGSLCEELAFYLLSLQHNSKIHQVLPYDLVVKYGQGEAANRVKYTHLWFNSKFKKVNVDKIKEKVKKEFSESYYLIEEFEKYLKKHNIELKFC